MRLPIVLFVAASLWASDCKPSALSEHDTLEQFKRLDAEAQGALEQKQYATAVTRYRDATCLVPRSARAFYGLGTAEAASGNFLAARQALETARDLLPGSVMPLTMLVRVNVALKDSEKLKDVLRAAAERFPKDAEFHSGIARFLAENQLLDLALAESLRFEQTGSTDVESTLALAVLENTVGAYSDALRSATAVEDNASLPAPLRASAAGIAGLSHESLGQREAAIQELKKAIEWAPSQENSYLALAFIYEKAEKFRDAASILERGRLQIPGSLAFLLPLGTNLVRAGEFDRGVQVLNKLLQKDAAAVDAYVRLAEAYRSANRPELELETLRKLARVNPDYPMIHVLMAQVMLSAYPVNYGDVLQELARAEKAAPADADVFYLRGKAYIAQNQLDDAVTALKRAIELRPTETGPYYQLGMVYRKLGKPELASPTLERVKQLNDQSARR